MSYTLLCDLGQGILLDHFGLLNSDSNAHLRLFLKARFKNDSKALDIHVYCLLVWEHCLRCWICRLGWWGNTVTADLLNGVSRAIFQNLGLMAVGSRRFEEEIGAADMTVDDWVCFHQCRNLSRVSYKLITLHWNQVHILNKSMQVL